MTETDSGTNWWRPDRPAIRADVPGSPVAFGGLVAFTAILLLTPQTLLPVLKTLRIALLAAGVSILAHMLDTTARRQPIVRSRREIVIAFTLLIWAAITIPFSYWPSGSVALLSDQYLKAVIFFWLIATLVTTRQRLRTFAWALVLCSIPLAIIGIQHFRSGEFLYTGVEGLKRIAGYSGLSGNPNDLALTLNLIIPFAGALIALSRGVVARQSCRRRAAPERDDGDHDVLAGRVLDPVGNRHPVHDLLRQAPCPRRGGDHGGGDADGRAAPAGRLHGSAEHHHRFRGGPDRIGARPVERLPGGHPLCRRQPDPRRRNRAGHPGARPAPCAGRPGDRFTTRISSMPSISGCRACCCFSGFWWRRSGARDESRVGRRRNRRCATSASSPRACRSRWPRSRSRRSFIRLPTSSISFASLVWPWPSGTPASRN